MPRLLFFLAALTFGAPAIADSWPATLVNASEADASRAPRSVSPETALWSTELPGPGASTPCVHDDGVFLTCEVGDTNAVVRLSASGQQVWVATAGKAVTAKHRNATGANPSVVADRDRVYGHFKDTTLAAFDAASGERLWAVSLNDRFGPLEWWWDLGASPVTTSVGVAVAIQHDGASFVVTLDRDTGETLWKTDRTYDCAKENDQAYTTPSVVEVDGRELIVTWGADHVTAHDATNGKLAWECGGLNPSDEPMWRAIASAAVGSEVAIVPHGRGDWLAAVRLGKESPGESRLLWRRRGVGSDVPTPWIDGDSVYVLADKERFTSVDLMTGETNWSAKLPRSRAKHFASPVVVGDVLYTAREDGSFTVSRIDGGVEVLGVGDFEEPIVATPVMWGDDLLVRTRGRLYRFSRTHGAGQ